jgi:hypothetical protein
MTDAIALPESGDGSRRARREGARKRPPAAPRRDRPERPKRSRGRWPILLVIVALIVAGVGAWYVTRDDDAGPDASSEAPVTAERTTGLLVQRAGDGTLAGATLLIDQGSGGDLVYLPPGTMVEAPALGLVPLREAADDGGHDLLVSTIENLLGVPVTLVADLTPAQLADAVRPAAPLQVSVPVAVERRVGDRFETVFEAGLTSIEPEEVSDLLDLPGETDLDRLVRHQAFWQAWLDSIKRQGSRALPDEAVIDGLRGQIERLAAGEVAHDVLPVQAISGADNLYRVEKPALDTLLRRALPGTPSSGERIRVQVLNGTGAPGVAQQLVRPLLASGARMSLSGNADRFGYTTTQIIYYDDTHQADALRVQAALGLGEIVKSRTRITVVAVTVVVGTDFTSRRAGSTPTSQGAPP